jgi:hypothetical protein
MMEERVSSQPDSMAESIAGAAGNAVTVHVAEYQALRQEVNNRQTISNALVAADLTAFGVGVSATHESLAVLTALSVVSSLLWLFWLVQTLQIYRIAAYVALVLRPRLASLCHGDLLDWELYVRNLTHTRETVARALFGSPDTGVTPRISRNNDGIYVSMLLGGAAPVILSLIAIAAYNAKTHADSWALAIAASLLLWVYALLKAVSTLQTTRRISARIIEAAPLDQAAPPGQAPLPAEPVAGQ